MSEFFNNLKNSYIDVFTKYIDFKGTATRPQYWYFVLANFIISLLITIVFINILNIPSIISLYNLVLLVPSLAVAVRRLNDAGKSGWNLAWCLTGIGSFYVLYLLCLKSASVKE